MHRRRSLKFWPLSRMAIRKRLPSSMSRARIPVFAGIHTITLFFRSHRHGGAFGGDEPMSRLVMVSCLMNGEVQVHPASEAFSLGRILIATGAATFSCSALRSLLKCVQRNVWQGREERIDTARSACPFCRRSAGKSILR